MKHINETLELTKNKVIINPIDTNKDVKVWNKLSNASTTIETSIVTVAINPLVFQFKWVS